MSVSNRSIDEDAFSADVNPADNPDALNAYGGAQGAAQVRVDPDDAVKSEGESVPAALARSSGETDGKQSVEHDRNDRGHVGVKMEDEGKHRVVYAVPTRIARTLSSMVVKNEPEDQLVYPETN